MAGENRPFGNIIGVSAMQPFEKSPPKIFFDAVFYFQLQKWDGFKISSQEMKPDIEFEF